ncbi:MAG: Gfo/Idh/MocA family oxidoreductase [Gammaproteobacteria bacterium]|jgi:predicted dehydrogenase|nr:Gfo/Idh/MocA family oxidoreductase [Gammaproteobacteria bacterium]MDP6617357.1 Gfo/Idh/MocA family oxidoreductase [Gammaproteobacteria bacterium]MDP6694922.1 Gfo/Idh/MocA family oxidoreductase [Gammaproteobacteria bacterium]MDP7041348.1 Gfo/Idh/MocA family oxidoreductase [Gammaproteobacteria bacterium]
MTNGSDTVRLGIVGCGAITREGHLPQLLRFPNVEVRFLCDTTYEFAELAQLEFGLDAEITNDISDLSNLVDCALVAVPPRLHAPISMRLMQMGIDVMCEKPTADEAVQAQRMADEAKKLDRVLSVGLTTRFHRNNQVLKALVDSGELGEIVEVAGEMGAPLDWAMTTDAYYNKATTAGGVFYDVGVHMLDRVIWLLGDLDNLGYEDDSYGGVESNGILTADLHLPGKTVPFQGSFSWTHMLDNCIRIVGTEAIAEARLDDTDHVHLRRRAGDRTFDMVVNPPGDAGDTNPLADQWQDFLDAVADRTPPQAAADTTVRALQVIEEAYRIRTRMAQPWVETGRSAI